MIRLLPRLRASDTVSDHCMKFSRYTVRHAAAFRTRLEGSCFSSPALSAIRNPGLPEPLITGKTSFLYERRPDVSAAPVFFAVWQPPAFPYCLRYSIIGRPGLNHRVREGNGCLPRAHRHQTCFITSMQVSHLPVHALPLITQQRINFYSISLERR